MADETKPALAPAADPGPVTAPREKVLTLRGDDRGAAPADHERSVSLAEANKFFFATEEAARKANDRVQEAVQKAVAQALKSPR